MVERLRSMWTIPDLRKKILFTIGMLLVFRLAAHVPVPGIDPAALRAALSKNSGLNQVFGLLDVFSGGSFQQTFSVVALGVYPYITASIVVQLLQQIVPRLQALSQEGESGRNRLAQITRYLTVPLALLQAFGQIAILVKANALSSAQFGLFNGQTVIPSLAILISLTAGTVFLVWLGELITENGIGNGISLIIFANIVSRLPQAAGSQLVATSGPSGSSNGSIVTIALLGGAVLLLIFLMVMVYNAQRRVPVQYPTKRRVMQGLRAGSQTTYLPLQINPAGMIPLIFAQSILLLPTVVASYLVYSSNSGLSQVFTRVRVFLDSSNWWYWAIYGFLVFCFTFFYATVIWEGQNMAENLQKQGAFIPGIRPGPPTDRHLRWILSRITFGGALFLGIISLTPMITNKGSAGQAIQIASLLIVVGVVLDTVKQIEAQMVMRNYAGFLS
jgi:preprotein translocase subunit SecY